jgi:hypothetical protein
VEEHILRNVVIKSVNVEINQEDHEGEEIFEMSGPANLAFQNCCREQGMIDEIMKMLAEPSNRGIILESGEDSEKALVSAETSRNDKNQKSSSALRNWLDVRFKRIAMIHRLGWCAIKFLLQENTLSEEYLVKINLPYRQITAAARRQILEKLSQSQKDRIKFHQDLERAEDAVARSSVVMTKRVSVVLDQPSVMNALNILISQIQFPVHAAESLTAILHGNRNLLEQVVDEARIRTFVDLIKNEGPSDQFLDFFAAICSCDGEAMRKNQDLCLEELILNENCFKETLITMKALTVEEVAEMVRPSYQPTDYDLIPVLNNAEAEDVYGFEVRI